MDALGNFVGWAFVLMGVWAFAMIAALWVGLSSAQTKHEKEKERKLAMLKEHPELAKEIWQSIEDQEARFHAGMKSIGDALQKTGGGFQKSVTPPPKPKSHNGEAMVKLGLDIAKRIIK